MHRTLDTKAKRLPNIQILFTQIPKHMLRNRPIKQILPHFSFKSKKNPLQDFVLDRKVKLRRKGFSGWPSISSCLSIHVCFTFIRSL